jgi:hypothetical protein
LPSFRPEDYTATSREDLEAFVKKKVPRQLHPFLRGPVPLWWLVRAAALPGKALAVGIALWYRKGVTDRDVVRPSWKLWDRFGVGRHAAYRALSNLEAAGLIAVERQVGKNPTVTITTAPRPEWVG